MIYYLIMKIKDMNNELDMLKRRVIRKITGANVHKAENLLGAARVIIDQYSQTKDEKWLPLYSQAKEELMKFINS